VSTTKEERIERDKNLKCFLESFEKTFGHVPTWRRTKSGQYMFDEGLDTQFIVSSCLVGRYAYLMDHDGKQALQRRFFKH